MRPLPRPKVTLRAAHLRALAALADGSVAYGSDHGRVKIVVPELLADGFEGYVVIHQDMVA